MMETIAFIWASPGMFINLAKFGFMSVAIPIRMMIAPTIGIIIVIVFST